MTAVIYDLGLRVRENAAVDFLNVEVLLQPFQVQGLEGAGIRCREIDYLQVTRHRYSTGVWQPSS